MAMTDESQGEAAVTANGDGDVEDSIAKRRLRNRRLNLNKLAREDICNDVTKRQKPRSLQLCWSFTVTVDCL